MVFFCLMFILVVLVFLGFCILLMIFFVCLIWLFWVDILLLVKSDKWLVKEMNRIKGKVFFSFIVFFFIFCFGEFVERKDLLIIWYIVLMIE